MVSFIEVIFIVEKTHSPRFSRNSKDLVLDSGKMWFTIKLKSIVKRLFTSINSLWNFGNLAELDHLSNSELIKKRNLSILEKIKCFFSPNFWRMEGMKQIVKKRRQTDWCKYLFSYYFQICLFIYLKIGSHCFTIFDPKVVPIENFRTIIHFLSYQSKKIPRFRFMIWFSIVILKLDVEDQFWNLSFHRK